MAQFQKKRPAVLAVPVPPPTVGMALGPDLVALGIEIEQEANVVELTADEADRMALELVRGAAAARAIAQQQAIVQAQMSVPPLPAPTFTNGHAIKP